MPQENNVCPSVGAAVRHPVLFSTRTVEGLWFPAGWFDETEAVNRLFENWQPGARVLKYTQGMLLRYSHAVTLPVSRLAGWPLRRFGQTLCSAELTPDECARLPVADIWIVEGGQVLSLSFQMSEPFDLAVWIDIGGYSFVEMHDMQAVRSDAAVLVTPEPPKVLKDVLGDAVPEDSPAKRAFMKKLSDGAGKADKTQADGSTGVSQDGKGFWILLLMAFQLVLILKQSPLAIVLLCVCVFGLIVWGILLIWKRLFGPAQQTVAGKHSGKVKADTALPIPLRGVANVFPQRWRNWLARLAITSRLSRVLGYQQAAYIRRMLEMFENGRLDEALRHAIPLGGDGPLLGQAFGVPKARASLALQSRSGVHSSIQIGDELNAHLQRLYRTTFERFDREGRIDEAVFILAELLHAKTEALDYLERYQRYRQAAELALAWDQAPDTIVRLYCLAGDWRYAVAVARRDGAFANAVLQLENKWPDAAVKLRLEWGEALAAQGEWLAAVDAVWPVVSAREQALQWLTSLDAVDDRILQARALVMRAALQPDALESRHAWLESVRSDPDQARVRQVLAEAVLGLKVNANDAVAAIIAAILPMIMADQIAGRSVFSRKQLQTLVTVSRDTLYAGDLPGKIPATAGRAVQPQERFDSWHAPVMGHHPVHDAIPLLGECYLAALGEAGVLMVNRQGKPVCRFPVPAEQLVCSYSQQVVLALVNRGKVWRVSRIDLVHRKVTALGQIRLDAFGNEFDGLAWTVVTDNKVKVLDVSTSLDAVLWQVTDLPGRISAFRVSRRLMHFLTTDGRGEYQLWRYALPGRQLHHRNVFSVDHAWPVCEILPVSSAVIKMRTFQEDNGRVVLQYAYLHGRELQVVLSRPEESGGQLKDLASGPDWCVVAYENENGESSIHQLDIDRERITASVCWGLHAKPKLRTSETWWMVFDDQGRLFHVDMEQRTVVGVSIV